MQGKFNFYSRFESGHRDEYIKFTVSHLNGKRVALFNGAINSKPMLFLMVEECFFMFFIISTLRSFFGYKTIGLVFRAKECVSSSSFKHKLKMLFLKIIKKNKNATTLSIIPFFVCPEIESICDDWIYDFQFCDIDFLRSLAIQDEMILFKEALVGKIKNRKVICALGKQDKSKGFDLFISNYIDSKLLQENFLFVAGGKVSGIEDQLLDEFKKCGGIVYNKKISDSELIALYEIADFIWACYSPEYDQSSGILGRGLQFEKTVVVRKGSVAESVAKKLEANFVTMTESSDSFLQELNNSINFQTSTNIKLKNNLYKLKLLLEV